MQYLHFRFMETTFFYRGRFPKKVADDQCSSITKGSIYHIKHTYIQSFTTVPTVMDLREICCLMEAFLLGVAESQPVIFS